jgi:hypothetical protein
MEAQDNLLKAKIAQSVQSNKHHSLSFPFAIGAHVHLCMLCHWNEYKSKDEKQVTKFMPRFDGLYMIINVES